MRVWNDPLWVERTPLVTTCLFESANAGQIVRMWSQHTAAGQSIPSWLAVNVALWLWANFYRVVMPDQKWARLCIKIGITINFGVILTAAYFRYWVGNG